MNEKTTSTSRRRLLSALGIGATAAAIGAVASTERLFAKRFAQTVVAINLPAMSYDPELQMMVDPASGQPIYSDVRNLRANEHLPSVTAGCKTCPKCDDHCN